MMNPDLNDPEWQKQRETLWKKIANDLGGEISRKKLSQLRPMFFEMEFDYGNERKYGDFRFDALRASIWCPVQTVERWRKHLTQDLHRWKGGRGFNFADELKAFAGLNLSRDHLGWDIQTELEVIRYILGDNYQPQGFAFEGQSTIYPVSANYVHYWWISNISKWLRGALPNDDVKWAHLLDYWASALPYVDPIMFKLKYSRNGQVSRAQYSLQSTLLRLNNYDIEKIKQTKLQGDEPVIVEDSGKRSAFVSRLKLKLSEGCIPEGLRALWKTVQQQDFEFPEWHDYLNADEDIGDQVAKSM